MNETIWSALEGKEVCMLDLVETLCLTRYPYHKKVSYSWWIEHEESYDEPLVKLLLKLKKERNIKINLVTARNISHHEVTRNRINQLIDQELIDTYYFNPKSYKELKPHEWKSMVLDEMGKDSGKVFAIESNAVTRRMYQRRGVYAFPKRDILKGTVES